MSVDKTQKAYQSQPVDLALMQQAMVHAVEGASRIGLDGCYTYVNERYAEIAGRRPEDMLDRPWSMTVFPDDLPMLEDAYAEMVAVGKVTREARGIKPDGTVFHERVTMISEHDEAGALIGHFCFAQDITDTQEVTEQSRRKGDWLELTEKIGKIGHWFVDLNEETVFWSDEVCRIHGVDPKEGAPSLADAIDFYHPDDREFVSQTVAEAIEHQREFSFEKRLIRPDGAIRWVASRGECRPGADGTPTAIFGIFRDITEERESELFRERIWQILTARNAARHQKIQMVLEEAAAYFGLTFGLLGKVDGDEYTVEFSSDDVVTSVPGTQYAFEHTYCWHVMNANEVKSFNDVANSEFAHQACYKTFGLEAYIGAPLFVNGERYGALSFSSRTPRAEPFTRRDHELIQLISTWVGNELGRQIVLDELQISERRFALAVLGSGVGISDWQDLSQDEQYWSDQQYRLLGYEPGEVRPSASWFVEQMHVEDRDQVVGIIRAHLKSGARYEQEARIRLKDGSYRWFMGTGQAVWDEEGRPVRFIGTILDIHERKCAETAKSEFVSTVSHELRTPLTSILGVLGLVNTGRYGELSERGSELLTLAQDSSERLVRLINDLLDIEKVESGTVQMCRQPSSIVSVVKDAVTQFGSGGDKAAIDLVLGEGTAQAHCDVDPDRMIQVMTNLLSNASKFSPSEGQITVRVDVLDDAVSISVADQGPGIPEDQFDRIFERFTQVDSSDTRAEGGTGLGLAISKAIVQGHDGRIGVANGADGGAVFTVHLPRVGDAETADTDKASPSVLPRILYVEDDENTVFLIRHVFEGVAEVISAKSRAEADQMLAENECNLVLLDLNLPDKPGESFLEHIAASQTQSPPVIVYSVKDYEPSCEWDFVRGAYVKSQIDMDVLRDHIVAELNVTPSAKQQNGHVKWAN